MKSSNKRYFNELQGALAATARVETEAGQRIFRAIGKGMCSRAIVHVRYVPPPPFLF